MCNTATKRAADVCDMSKKCEVRNIPFVMKLRDFECTFNSFGVCVYLLLSVFLTK